MNINGIFKPKNVLKGKILALPLIDKTLTQKNKAADAKATGDAIADVKKIALDGHNENSIAISKERTERKKEISVERARIDNIVTNNNDTEGNAELTDIRVGADGFVYDSAGEAVRRQHSTLNDKLEDVVTTLQLGNINNSTIEQGGIDESGREFVKDTLTRSVDFISVLSGNSIYVIAETSKQKYVNVRFYDINKNFVSHTYVYAKNLTVSPDLATILEIPENIAYMRFSTSEPSIERNLGIYYTYYNATTIEEYAEPVSYIKMDRTIKDGKVVNFGDSQDVNSGVASSVITANEQSKEEKHLIPEYEYSIAMVDVLQKKVLYLQDYVSKLHTPTVLDSGICGENLTWALYSDGLLKISGTGRSFDYCKGLMDGKTKEEIEKYVIDHPDQYYYGFQEGKVYDEVNAQYVAPWYKYRDEVSFIKVDGDGGYCSKAYYDSHNPNGWKYNRIEIDEGITYLGDWLFYRVSGATELIIPSTVTEIGEWSIRYSPTLKCIYLPDGIAKVGYRGCSRNEVATAIRVGSGLTTVGDYAFAQNSMVKYLCLQGNISETNYICNGNHSLEYVSFVDTETIGAYACVACDSLKKVDLPDTLKVVGEGAFLNLTGLTSIKIPQLVESIDKNAFYGCTNLKSVFIDSPAIALELTSATVFGQLIANANYIYIKSDVSEIGSYITSNFVKISDVSGYTLYIKNSIISNEPISTE